ncbi:DinB family protein [Paenisporosarcina indica]|uniref:DinB family protein n=1 Tax=Paenisporosarcina indica TaxID=650093 RepID=UPI00094FFC71|nr:DinB family protein [Paenisporosarcina indica]
MYKKPSIGEYPAYYGGYINLVPKGNLLDILAKQLEDTTALLSDKTETQSTYRYADGKWTLKEVIGHITDTERIMSYRLLRISRGDKTPLAGYNDEDYVKEAFFHTRSISELLEDFHVVRRSTISLLRGLPETAWARTGIANNSEISVNALLFIIAGHELHHVNIIKERYLI